MRYSPALAILLVVALALGSAASAQSRDDTKRPRRIVIHPRNWIVEPPPTAKRYCTSWLAKEYRVSGPVIVPHMQCRWQ